MAIKHLKKWKEELEFLAESLKRETDQQARRLIHARAAEIINLIIREGKHV